ncbi:MAG: hypothetical protein ACRC8A_04650 [Microcoleaceae cyanobacterium]
MTPEFRQYYFQGRVADQSLGWLNLVAGGIIGGSFLLWTVPPFFLAKNQISHLWVQGLSLVGAIAGSSIGLVIGYKLKGMEPVFQAERQQQEEDFLHWLASNRYYIESLRENAVEAALAERMAAGIDPLPIDPRQVDPRHYDQHHQPPERQNPQAALALMNPREKSLHPELNVQAELERYREFALYPPHEPRVPLVSEQAPNPNYLPSNHLEQQQLIESLHRSELSAKVRPISSKLGPKAIISQIPKLPLNPISAAPVELNRKSPAKIPEIPLGLRLSGPPEPQPLLTPDENDSRVRQLWDQLNAPGCEWLLQLLLTKPLLVWGEQCSGKTSFAGFLALLRMIFFGHQVSVSDPHCHQNSWPAPFEIYGGEYNYNQVNSRLVAYYQRLKTGSVPHTSIWDEVTQYQENCDPQLAGRFLKSILSDVRKPPEFPILLSHGNTLSALGGGKGGIKTMQSRGLVELNLRATRDHLGNLRPALRGNVTGLNVDEHGSASAQPIALESWMQPNYLLELFPELIFGGFVAEPTEATEEDLGGDRSSTGFNYNS